MKQRAFIYIILGLFFLTQNLNSQTFELPDTNFRNVLIKKYPKVIKAGLLDTIEASKFVRPLNLAQSKIMDLDGLRYFKGITILNVSSNNLTEIQDLGELKKLKYLFANNNKLAQISQLGNLTELIVIQLIGNVFEQIPNFQKCDKLEKLYINKNKLNHLFDFNMHPKIKILDVGFNPLKTNYNYGLLTQLTQLHLHSTGIDTLIGLEKLHKLEHLFVWGNNLEDLSSIDSLTNLETCELYNNNLEKLPNLSNKPNLNRLTVFGNYLTFEDLYPLSASRIASFAYAPQNKFNMPSFNTTEKNKVTFSVSFDKSIKTNKYTWQKENAFLDSSSHNTFLIQEVQFNNAGQYSLKINNAEYPDLVLYSNPFNLIVDSCLRIVHPSLEIVNNGCKEAYEINLDNFLVIGGTKPYEYSISSTNFNKVSTETNIQNIPSGKIVLALRDAKNCTVSYQFVLDRIKNCDPVLSPNQDGITDTYFVEEAGDVKVYDSGRNLINSFTAPYTWDGSKSNGEPAETGLYAIVIDGKKVIQITIIR